MNDANWTFVPHSSSCSYLTHFLVLDLIMMVRSERLKNLKKRNKKCWHKGTHLTLVHSLTEMCKYRKVNLSTLVDVRKVNHPGRHFQTSMLIFSYIG